MDKIYINNKLIDINYIVPITYSLFDLSNIDVRTGEISVQLSAPITNRNIAIFGNPLKFNSADALDNNVENTAIVRGANGIIKFKGFVKIMPHSNDSFKFYLYGNNNSWITKIDKVNITDLDLSELNHIYNESNINAMTTAGDNIVYGVIDYGVNGSRAKFGQQILYDRNGSIIYQQPKNTIKVEDMFPAISLYYLTNKVFNHLGYTVSGNFLNDIKDIAYLPFVNEKLKLEQSVIDSQAVDLTADGTVSYRWFTNHITDRELPLALKTSVPFQIQPTATGKYIFDVHLELIFDRLGHDEQLKLQIATYLRRLVGNVHVTVNLFNKVFDIDSSTYILDYQVTTDIVNSTYLDIDIINCAVSPRKIAITNAGPLFGGTYFIYELENIADIDYFDVGNQFVMTGESQVISTIVDLYPANGTIKVLLVAGQVEGSQEIQNISTRSLQIGANSTVTGRMQEDLFRDNDLNMTLNAPDINVKDFLQGITKRFNLIFETNNDTKIVKIETFDEYFGDQATAINWTDKIDKGKYDNFTVEKIQPPKKLTFKGSDDRNDKTLELFKENNTDEVLGSITIESDNLFSADEKTITDIFTDTAMQKIMIARDYEFAYINKSNPRTDISTKHSPRLLFFDKTTGLSTENQYYFEDTLKTEVTRLYSYDVAKPSNPISIYGNSKNQNGLKDVYYNNSLKSFYDGLKFGVWLHLTDNDILNLDFSKLYILETPKNGRAYFYLNRIDQFKSEKSTFCEFVKANNTNRNRVTYTRPSVVSDVWQSELLNDNEPSLGTDPYGNVVVNNGSDRVAVMGAGGFNAGGGDLVSGELTPIYAYDNNNNLYRVTL